MLITSLISAFRDGFTHVSRRKCIQEDKKLRDELSERQLDHMIMDSMPASDPPSTY